MKKIELAKKPSRKYWVKKLDDLARQVCYARDGNKSVLSGKTENLNPCHIYPKGRYTRLRWDLDNLVTLTWNEHLNWWHKNPIEASAWFREKYPDRYKKLKLRSQVNWKGANDYAGWELLLKQELKNYET